MKENFQRKHISPAHADVSMYNTPAAPRNLHNKKPSKPNRF